MVLKLDPKDKVARAEVAALPQQIADAKEKARKAFRPLAHAGDDTTLSAVKSSQHTLHRIPIEEIGGSDEEDDNVGVSAPAIACTEPSAAAAPLSTDAAGVMPANRASTGAAQAPLQAAPRKVRIEEVDDSDSDDAAAPLAAKAASPSAASRTASQEARQVGSNQAAALASDAVHAKSAPMRAHRAPATARAKSPSAAAGATSVGAAATMTAAKFETAWRRADDAGVLGLLQSVGFHSS